jgi:integrase
MFCRAVGGGFEAAPSFNLIVAERSAKFAFLEVLFNHFRGMGAYTFLSRRIAPGLAERMILSGEVYSAEDLFRLGAVDVLTPDGAGVEPSTHILGEEAAARLSFFDAAARRIANPVTREEMLRIAAVGPAWGDVERLILSTDGNTARDIRDQAILRLLATYGFRRGEVSRLRLDDVDWDHDRLLVRRPKQRGSQEYPLLPSVGDAIARYLQDARPKSPHREIFLTLRAPIVALSGDGLYDVVYSRLKALGIASLRRGPHALRHACAGRLVAQGLSLKEIGDHLGHRSASATRIYAKVDLAGLREVAAFDLGGLL